VLAYSGGGFHLQPSPIFSQSQGYKLLHNITDQWTKTVL